VYRGVAANCRAVACPGQGRTRRGNGFVGPQIEKVVEHLRRVPGQGEGNAKYGTAGVRAGQGLTDNALLLIRSADLGDVPASVAHPGPPRIVTLASALFSVSCGDSPAAPTVIRCPSANVALCTVPEAAGALGIALRDSRIRIVPALQSQSLANPIQSALLAAEAAVAGGDVLAARNAATNLQAALTNARSTLGSAHEDQADLEVIALSLIHLELVIY
jgi:hypothetical protein